MLTKLKKYLGIEGVRLELLLPESVPMHQHNIEGKIHVTSHQTQTVGQIKISIFEKYQRGRSSNKRTNEYKLGEIIIHRPIIVPAKVPIDISFVLPFERMNSEMDELEKSNVLLGGVVKAAKLLKGVKSEFRVEATASVEGARLYPFTSKAIIIN
ncbi:MAG: sporulation protein [Saprospiraceae bacterium]|nr:sporulation protein [Saprospiraceae bacterium]MBP7699578.1 sporulation protein [Saprospiraceae bacterium]